MKKNMSRLLIGLFLFSLPNILFAETICFEGGGSAAGRFVFLSGGKIDQKPFAGHWISPQSELLKIPIWGAIVTDGNGMIRMSLCVPHYPTGMTSSSCVSVSGTAMSLLSGYADDGQDGTIDRTLTLTEVNCNSLPISD